MSGQRYSVTIDVGADISSAKSAAQQLKNVFEGIGLGAGQSSRISGMFKDLDKALDEVARRSSTALTSIGEARGLDKAKERVVSIINAINSEFAKMGKLEDTDLAKNFGDLTRRVNDASKAIKTYNSTIGSLSKGHTAAKNRANELGQELAEQTKYYEQLQKIRDKFKGSSDKDISEALAKRQSTAKGLATRRQNELESFVKARGGRINADKTVDKGWRKSFESKASAEDVETLNKLVTAAQNASNAFKTAQENYQNFSNAMSNFKGQKNFDELTKSAREAADELKKFESGTLSTEAFNKLKLALEQAFGPEVTAGIQNSATAVEEFQERINQISAKELDEFRKKVPEIDNLLNQLANTGEEMGKKVKKGTESFYNMKEAASDIEHLSSRLKYFFSLAGGFNLMRRAIRSAVTTTKELDAVMTQTAVVSSYTVKDMWKTLPQYSKEAKKLGVAIKDVYSAQTLYVQQGLDMNSAMDIGVETMKMARVANIGAEEATNSMTAALRGFNMELNETSAKRINDVYSKLAQNTASNTQEISTAMTKTAALANSANMSFENTAAFLATIIESTREGAETAGTALKTVIARFTEVKKLYSTGELLGTDEEGQEVDVNKISKALRTAGINMNEFFTGAKGLDEIFMELGSKWDSLTTVQQRYIATMAAGSRQQSRFLALMQNYSRTVQLTEMAYNSAGSGEEQFNKTLDSLEAKINQFKAAWDTFIMGIANSDLIKDFIDFGTTVLETINKITDALSGGNGLIKSIMSLGLAFGVFKGLGSIFKNSLGKIGAVFRGVSEDQPKGIVGRWTRTKSFLKQRASDWQTAKEWRNPFKAKQKKEEIQQRRAELEKQVATDKQKYENSQKELADLKAQGAREWGKNRSYSGDLKQIQEAREKDYQGAIEKKDAEVKDNQTKLDNSQKELSTHTQQTTDAFVAQASAMQTAGVAAGVAAGIFGALASKMEETGHSDLAAWCKGLAIGFTVLSGALTLAGTAFMALGAAAQTSAAAAAMASAAISAIPIIGWAVAIISALVAVGVAISHYVVTVNEEIENAEKSLDEHQDYLSNLKKEYDEISQSITSISEQQDAISNMTQGTLEWNSAVENLNNNLRELGNNFPEFLDAIEFDKETGQLTLNIEKAKTIQKEKENTINSVDQEITGLKVYSAEKNTEKKLSKYIFNTLGDQAKNFADSFYSSDLQKYGSQYFKDLWMDLWSGTTSGEEIDNFKKLVDSDVWNGYINEYLLNYIRGFAEENQKAINEGKYVYTESDIQNILQIMSDYVEQAEIVRNFQTELGSIIKPEAMSYVAESGQYVGVVKTIGANIYSEAYKNAFDSFNETEVDLGMIQKWAERNGYTYDSAAGTYTYEEDGEKVTKSIDNTVKKEILSSAKHAAATSAAQEATKAFFDSLANESYALISGKGTYRQYAERYNATLGPGNGENGYGYYAKAGQEEEYQLYKTITNDFLEARKRINTVAGTDTDKEVLRGLDSVYQDLNYLQTTAIANLAESWQSKFGINNAKNLLKSIETKISNTSKDNIPQVTDNIINVLSLIESGAITNLEEFAEALGAVELDIADFDIGYVFNKPKTFEQAQEAIKNGLELWNTARSSNVFSAEDVKGLTANGQMSKEDFILTSQGYVSKKTQAETAAAAKDSLVKETKSAISGLDKQIEVIEKFNQGYKTLETSTDKGEKESFKKINKVLSNQDLEKLGKENPNAIRDVLGLLLGGENADLYNKNTGESISLGNIADADLAGYLQDILNNQDLFSLKQQKKALETEEQAILDNKLLDMAPAIQDAVVNIISQATEKGIDITDNDIEQFVDGRQQFSSDKKYAEFLNGLDQLDWDEIDDIDDFIRKLKNLGIEFNRDSDGAQGLFNRLQEIYATDTTPAQKVEKQLSKVEKAKGAAERLASGEKVFSKEDVDNLRDVLDSKFNESEWKQTGSNEWLYVGEQTNSILSNIDGAVQAIAGKIINEAKEGVEKGQKIQGIIDSTQWPKSNGDKRPWGHAAGEIFAESTLKTFNDSALQDLAKYLDIGTQDEEGNPLERESLISLILDYYNKYYGENGEALAANTALVGSAQTTADTLLYQQSGQGLLNNTDITDEKRSEVLSNRVQGLEAGEQYMVGKSMDSMLPAVKTIVEDGTIVRLEEDLEGVDKKTKDYQQTLNALTLDAKRDIKNFEDLSQAYKDNASALTTEKKGTAEYGRALGNLTASAKKAFNNNEVITEDFVENNLELFKDYSEGVEGSTEAIRDAVAQEMLKTGKSAEAVQTALTALDGAKFDINGNADFSNVFNQFAATKEQADALATVLRSLGYTVTLKMGDAVEDPVSHQIVGYNWTASVSNSAGNVENANRSGGGGGGGGGGNKEFKNDFDKYYNQVEDINELERQRNLLEKDYNQLLKSESLSGKEIYDNLKAQIELLKERRFLVQDLAEKRKQQILDTMQDEQYKDVAKYSWWNEEDQTIEIDWQSIDKIKDSETGDLVKEYVSKLEDFQSKYDEQIDALEDIEDTLQEIKERGKDQYQTTEERLRDALIKQIQDKIDELTEVNEAINETNQKLFDSISETLELQRQERENAKTEEELTDKEKRLAYLQQDSSNANALEIAKLQEELADARENYTDTLIDQKISELQKQNEEAQEQRQEQIDLMQRSLEWQENSGAFWNTVYQYISEGTDAIGALIPGSNLVRLLKDGEAWDSLSEEMQMNWLKELETLVSEATGYLALNRQLEDIGTKEGTEIEFITADGRTLKGKVDKNGNVVVTNEDGSTSTYKDVYQDYYGTYKTLETEGELKEAPKPATTTKPEGTEKPPEYTGSDQRYTLGRNTVWSFPKKSLNGKYSSLAEAEAAARSANDSQTEILQAQINSLEKDIQDNGINTDKKTRLDNLNGLLKYRNTVGYATGGIADFTGPAWLDGTKAHPELVLNARDTQNFIELKDVLADMRKNGGLSLTGGDNYYDIKVQVDSLGSDYDVDRAIDRIKARIAQDGAYRNVNTLSRLR